MRPIIVASLADAPAGAPATAPRIAAPGGCDVRRMIDGDKAPIHLTAYRPAQGAMLNWESPERCRTLFVRKGGLSINGKAFGPGSTIVIEAGAQCLAQATADGTEFFEFLHNREPGTLRGGKVHAVEGGQSPVVNHGGVDSSLHADSTCPGCGVWLQETFMTEEGREIDIHAHSEDEVIVVLDGELLAGPRKLGPGTALSVARNTFYGFSAGKGGLRFINFRPSRPGYIPKGGKEIVDELTLYTGFGVTPAVHTPI